MAKVEKEYSFENPNYKFGNSPLDERVVTLEQKFSRLTLWISLLTFFLVVSVIGAAIVQILLNGEAPPQENSTAAALARHSQRQSVEGGAAAITHSDMKLDLCCQDLALKLALLEQRFQEALSQLELHTPKVVVVEPPSRPHHTEPPSPPHHTEPPSPPHHAEPPSRPYHSEPPSRPHHMPTSRVAPKPSGEGQVLPEISPETLVEKGIEYDYPDELIETGSGDDNIFIDSPESDYDLKEKEASGSGIGSSISDDEDLTPWSHEASGCRPFARPVCSDGCVTEIMQAGCPVPVCCKALPKPDTISQSSGPHHHHH